MGITKKALDECVLPRVTRPSRYTAPFATPAASDGTAAGVCLLVPMSSEEALARPMLRSLRDSLIANGPSKAAVDFVFRPGADLDQELVARDWPLFGLGQALPLAAYDLILVLSTSVLQLPDVLWMLDRGGVALHAAARRADDPLVLLGGSLALTPAPGGIFFDAALAGDPEAFAADVVELAEARRCGRGAETLKALAGRSGVWLPGPAVETTPPVPARWLAALPPVTNAVPRGDVREDALPVEFQRSRGAAFPLDPPHSVRRRDPAEALGDISAALAATGYGEVLFAGTGDEEILPLLESLHQRFAAQGVTGRLEAVDPAHLSPALARELRKGQRARLTLAPVACSARLRRLFGRPLEREAFVEAVAVALRGGWSQLRLQVILGAPGETTDDREEWAATMEAVSSLRSRGAAPARVTLELLPAVVGPETALGALPEELEAIAGDWKKRLGRGNRFRVHLRSPRASRTESLLLRAGSEAGPVLEAAWKRGARAQGDPEGFDPAIWEGVLPQENASATESFFSRPVDPEGIEVPPSPEPVSNGGEGRETTPVWFAARRPRRGGRGREARQSERYRVRFSKSDPFRFTAHLDVGRALDRAFRRARVPVAVTQGKDRRRRIAYGPPLPLGMTSAAEYFDVVLEREVPETFVAGLHAALPEGLAVLAAGPIRNEAASLSAAVGVAEYQVWFPDCVIGDYLEGMAFDELKARLEERVAGVMASDTLMVTRVRKARTQTLNVRPSLLRAEVLRDDGGRPVLAYRLTLNRSDSVRPELLTSALCSWVDFDPRLLRVHRAGLFIPAGEKLLDPLDVVRADFAWWKQPARGGTVL